MSSIFNSHQPQLQQQLGSRWWMRGSMPRRVAESIIQLVRDMASVYKQYLSCAQKFNLGCNINLIFKFAGIIVGDVVSCN